ncbi:MAG: hypothetical protein AAGB51_04660 [Planctomycetota bacterium]
MKSSTPAMAASNPTDEVPALTEEAMGVLAGVIDILSLTISIGALGVAWLAYRRTNEVSLSRFLADCAETKTSLDKAKPQFCRIPDSLNERIREFDKYMQACDIDPTPSDPTRLVVFPKQGRSWLEPLAKQKAATESILPAGVALASRFSALEADLHGLIKDARAKPRAQRRLLAIRDEFAIMEKERSKLLAPLRAGSEQLRMLMRAMPVEQLEPLRTNAGGPAPHHPPSAAAAPDGGVGDGRDGRTPGGLV